MEWIDHEEKRKEKRNWNSDKKEVRNWRNDKTEVRLKRKGDWTHQQ